MKKLLTVIILLGSVHFLFGVNVTFQLNMATFPGGATDSTSTVHIRGDMNGWSDTDQLANVGGDYWSTTLVMTAGETAGYKFTHTDDLDALTWEGIDNRSITVPATDTTIMHYFDNVMAYTATDSIDVWFRVNMGGVTGFDTASAVGVRGGEAPLDWDSDLALVQEGDTYFYSGQGSFGNANTDSTIEYKFVYDQGGVNWEGVDNRTFVAGSDTTLAWRWFNDQPAVAELDTFLVEFIVNMATTAITDSAVTGFYVSGDFNGWSQNDSLTAAGDYWSKTIELVGSADGIDVAYKFRYTDSIGDEYWEGVDNRTPTITSDTSIFAYWDDVAPFTPTDSIDVWFRVNMEGVAGFDTASAVGVRGGEAPLDWGADLALTQEGDTYFYSGLGSFVPDSSLGDLVEYKFVYDQGGVNWEGDVANRTFVANVDTTLAFWYFNDEPPTGETAVTAYVYFAVDMDAYEDMSLFSVVRQDSMQVRGGFNGWGSSAEPDGSDLKMTRITGTTIYELNAPVTKFPNTDDAYKYYIKLSQESLDHFDAINPYFYGDMGYENPPVEGAGNRSYTFVGDPQNPQMIGLQFYNGLPFAGIVPDGHTVAISHSVDMSGIITEGLFDAATDSVWLIYHDHWSFYLSGYWTSANYRHDDLLLNDTGIDGDATAGDGIYTVTFDITGKIPFYMMYTYQIGGVNALEEGGGFDYGRYRIRYIRPTGTVDNLTYPTAWVFPQDTWTTDPPLTVESPPSNVFTATENEINLPTTFTVFQNYPNPFNPVTEIKFTLPEAGLVTLNIYNVLGQKVVSFENNFSAPGTYGLRWNGRDNQNQAVSSGIYFYELRTANHRITKKMTLLK
ncbi:MAG: T9SS type A sorting domain-containing protein [Candidatus Marinimicrobia bacterium]|nr:T9SS type A sorting domain-containing protein [Candidatus Neomarinimicrobiota bacterium]